MKISYDLRSQGGASRKQAIAQPLGGGSEEPLGSEAGGVSSSLKL